MDYSIINGNFIENNLEEAIISLFQEQGYTYVQGEAIDRQYEDILLLDDLKEYINGRYNAANLSEVEIQKIINTLDRIPEIPLYAGNKNAFWLINEGFDLVREDTSLTALHVEYINFDEPDKNIFKIVNQYTVRGSCKRRPDLLVFINGIPVAIFELKTISKENITIHDAWEQITVRYCRDIPKLMKYCFMSVISDGSNTRMGSIFTPYPYYYAWNKADGDDKAANGIGSLLTMLKGAFAKERIIAILRDFIFYPDESGKEEAIVCRYPQFFAANRMLKNIKLHLRPGGDGKGGTYFGATGSGKTYAMLFLARMIGQRDNKVFTNPTVILIVDRDDLDTQASELFVTAKRFLGEADVRSINDRQDLWNTLHNRQSGGVYITTIQKFCESTGLLSDRSNIVCISDEAHRTQTGIGAKLLKNDEGLSMRYGFAKYLRDSFPNATYCGFTGTPTDESIAVFGPVVDRYTMQESADDGITVHIAYEPRLARVVLSEEEAKKIQKYYAECAEAGSTEEQILKSQKAMSRITAILNHPERIGKMAKDIVDHYETLCRQKPKVVQKAMIVCADRMAAFNLLNAILAIRPSWGEERKAEDESAFTKEQLKNLTPIAKINLVATQGSNDPKELFDMCGSKVWHKFLDKQFKNNDSNFKIAVVVDMWITGFDVPSLSVMYIDKPIQKHNLIQTISRVNRVFEGKDKGLVVDYIGIRNSLLDAMKSQEGDSGRNPIEDIKITVGIFRKLLAAIDKLLKDFDDAKFYSGTSLERLMCLNYAAEYVQSKEERQKNFMNLTRALRPAFDICAPSGELNEEESAKAQFYLIIRSTINKQTPGDAPDAEAMNEKVEKMVQEAISCTGIENILSALKVDDLSSEEFRQKLDAVKLPITKFNYLLKLLKEKISKYGKKNRLKAIEFDKRLQAVVDKYNNRDNLVFTNEVVSDVVDNLSEELMKIYKALLEDEKASDRMGISVEEKVFYDILVKVRDTHGFIYEDEKCILLAKEIKKLVDEKSEIAYWTTRQDIKSDLEMKLTLLLYENKYPDTWTKEIFEKIMEQKEYFDEYSA